ncbi:MAG TPA: TetR family transcriptional regulator [Solirubrobacteraceae bacterium]|nr:TetR family transcriptional regulator [Solirubrobacteraceae bacterium]
MPSRASRPTAASPDALGVGGPRSEGTRRTILDAARALFAARGYEQTTIRAVAGQAGIDASMVMRYFGSKAGLFAAAATRDLDPPDIAGVPARGRGEALVRHFVNRWEVDPSEDMLVFLLRTAVTDGSVAEQLQTTFDRIVVGPLTALDYPDAERRAALIGSQLMGLALCRYILQLQPLASLSGDEIVAGLAPAIQRYLTQPMTGA